LLNLDIAYPPLLRIYSAKYVNPTRPKPKNSIVTDLEHRRNTALIQRTPY